jgi:hypothetical protein
MHSQLALCVEYRIKQTKASNFRRRNYRVFLTSYKPLNWRGVLSGRIVVTDKGRLLIAAAAEIPGEAFIRPRGAFGYNSGYKESLALAAANARVARDSERQHGHS